MNEIQFEDDLIVTKDTIMIVIKLDPINVFSLDKQEQDIFFRGLEVLLRSLKEDSIKIGIKIRRLEINDVEGHFKNISKGDRKNEINNYIDELMGFITLNNIPFAEYHLIVSENGKHTKTIGVVRRRVENLMTHFNALGIGTNIIKGNKLKEMVNNYI